MKRFRIQLVIAFIVLVCGVSLMGLIYILFNNHSEPVTPGVVVSQPSPVATPFQPFYHTPIATHPHSSGHVSGPYYNAYTAPAPSMPAIPMRGLYETSNAQAHSVGGGGNGYGISATSGSSSSRGIQYSNSVTMPSTSFIAMASNRTMSQPGSADAPQMAQLAVAPHRNAPGPPDTGDDPLDPEHQLPIGAPWILALLAFGYTFSHLLTRKKSES